MPSEPNDERDPMEADGDTEGKLPEHPEMPKADDSAEDEDLDAEIRLLGTPLDSNRPFEDVHYEELFPQLEPEDDLLEMEIILKNIWDF